MNVGLIVLSGNVAIKAVMTIFSSSSDSALQQELESLLHPEHHPPHHHLRVQGKMKKYYKLVLVVVTVISLVSFIFYKTQYDKLYNVLEVLEFFGPGPDGNG